MDISVSLRLKTRWPQLSEQEQKSWLSKASDGETTATSVAAAPASQTMGVKRRKTAVSTIATVLEELPSAANGVEVLVATVRKLESRWPGFAGQIVTGLSPLTGEDAAECSRCAGLLGGLFSLPGFDAPYPNEEINEVRHSLDRLVRTTFGERDTVRKLGYAIGMRRWDHASEDAPAQRSKRGKPSQVNCLENVARVKELLQKYSQPSSTPCMNTDGDWVLAQTLTRRRTTLFEESGDVKENMSARASWSSVQNIDSEPLCSFSSFILILSLL